MGLRDLLRATGNLEFSEAVPDCERHVLFEFGEDASHVPNLSVPGIGGFTFMVDGGRFQTGADVSLQLQVARLSLDIGMNGSVVSHSLEGGTRIEVSSKKIGGAAMHLAMTDLEGGGSLITYGIELHANTPPIPGSIAAIERLIKGNVGNFASQYKTNILRAVPPELLLMRPNLPPV